MIYKPCLVDNTRLTDSRNGVSTPENHLVARARRGDKLAFDELFARNRDRIFAFILPRVGEDREISEEAVGSVFLSAYRSLGLFRGDSSFVTWLCRIAANEASARIRNRRHLGAELSVTEPEMTAQMVRNQKYSDPETQLIRNEDARTLKRVVCTLPEPYRTPVMLRYCSGLRSRTIADALNRPAGTVRYQLSRGLQILRERLGTEWSA